MKYRITWRVYYVNHFYSNINDLLVLLFEQTIRNIRQKEWFPTCVLSIKMNPFLYPQENGTNLNPEERYV